MGKHFIVNEDFTLFTNKTLVYELTNVVNQSVKISKVDNDFIFTTNYLACPRIAYCKIGNDFIFDLYRSDIKKFVKKYFPNDYKQEVVEEPMVRFKTSVKKDYEIKHINYIENWSKVIVHNDGSFEKIDYPLKPYSIPLKDAYYLVKELLCKYKRGVDKLISEHRFVPTITGGLDTRCLTSLYREQIKNSNIFSYFTCDVKPDGKNRVDLGKSDLECSKMVANHLGLYNHNSILFPNETTLSGMFTESTRCFYKLPLNDERFIFKFIQHRKFGVDSILPFIDDLFLQIKQPRKNVFRCLMCLMLCPDLLQYKCIGTYATFEKYNYQPYDFYEEYKDYIQDAQDILDYWGEEKVKNILIV